MHPNLQCFIGYMHQMRYKRRQTNSDAFYAPIWRRAKKPNSWKIGSTHII